MTLREMLEAKGWTVLDIAPATLSISKGWARIVLSTTPRNGGRGYWHDGRRHVIPKTKGHGWRDALVAWACANRAARKFGTGQRWDAEL